jgi:hypothetical protein
MAQFSGQGKEAASREREAAFFILINIWNIIEKSDI